MEQACPYKIERKAPTIATYAYEDYEDLEEELGELPRRSSMKPKTRMSHKARSKKYK